MRRGLIISAAAVLSIAGLAEVGIRLLAPADAAIITARARALGFEHELVEVSPSLGWKLAAGAEVELEGVAVRTNRLGLRGPDPVRPAILVLGDGAAFGVGVEEASTWPAQIAGATGEEVLNAAVPGYSSAQGRVLLETLLEQYAPRLVILAFGLEDARLYPVDDVTAAALAQPSGLRRSRLVDRCYRRLGPAAALATASALEADRVRLVDELATADDPIALRAALDAFEERHAGLPERVAPKQFEANLKAMIARARAGGASVVLLGPMIGVSSPAPELAGRRYRTPPRVYREVMRRVSRETGVSYAVPTVLTEDAREPPPGLFLTRPLTETEQRTLAALKLDITSMRRLGIHLNRRYRDELRWPSVEGHRIVAETLRSSAAKRPPRDRG